jgi:hypothetical protein
LVKSLVCGGKGEEQLSGRVPEKLPEVKELPTLPISGERVKTSEEKEG